jgi:ABC-type glycerol-3-phosphate transport system substrate-binding protein
MSPFQLIVTGLFAAFIVVGVAVFALFGGAFGGSGVGAVVVWGTVDEGTMQYLLDSMRSVDGSLSDTSYVKKDAATYRTDLVNAMAAGTGPDVFVVSQEDLGAFQDKIAVIPYSAVSQQTYLSSYIDEGQLFLTSRGALALPFSIDPLVMYWNKDMFSTAGIAGAPQYWSDVITQTPTLTKLDGSSNVKQSAVALGAWSNINNAKAVLSALFMQAGDYITTRSSDRLVATIGSTPPGAQEPPGESALRFYTEFSDPSKTTYSWNRSLKSAADAFTGGQLAMYFGFAGEYPTLLARNPNLNIGVALLPQLKGSSLQVTYGSILGLAVSRGARNLAGAGAVAQKLTSPTAAGILTSQTGLPPVRRDVATNTSASAAASVFVQSALISRGWTDPDPTATNAIFKTMIDSTVSGQNNPSQAVSEAAQAFGQLLPNRAN